MAKKQSNILDKFRTGLEYELAGVEMDFTESLESLMQRRGVNKSELARLIDTSPAYITKIMRGGTNFTLETMVKLVRALDGELQVRACAVEDDVRWFGVVDVKQSANHSIEKMRAFEPMRLESNRAAEDMNHDLTVAA